VRGAANDPLAKNGEQKTSSEKRMAKTVSERLPGITTSKHGWHVAAKPEAAAMEFLQANSLRMRQ